MMLVMFVPLQKNKASNRGVQRKAKLAQNRISHLAMQTELPNLQLGRACTGRAKFKPTPSPPKQINTKGGERELVW